MSEKDPGHYTRLRRLNSNRGINDSEVHLVVCFCLPLEDLSHTSIPYYSNIILHYDI